MRNKEQGALYSINDPDKLLWALNKKALLYK